MNGARAWPRRPLGIPFWLGRLALAIVGAFWVGAVAVPIGFVLSRVESAALFFDPGILSAVRVTVFQASLSTALSFLVGLPLGLWIGGSGGRASSRAGILLSVPFAVPSVVASLAWILLLGRSGFLARMGLATDWMYSLKAVILAHVFFNIPWIALLVSQARRTVSPRQLDAARTLGAGALGRLRFVLWPEVKWASLSAAAQTFSFCAMSFALVLLLGGGPPVHTLETSVYSRIRYGSLDLSGAVVCAVWELLVTLLPWALVIVLRYRQGRVISRVQRQGESQGPSGFGSRAGFLVAAIFSLPYFGVFLGTQTGWLSGLARVVPEILGPLGVSVRLALASAFLSTFLALLAVVAVSSLGRGRSVVSILLLLPGGLSVMVLGLGLWLAYGSWIDPFSGSLAAMVAVQSTVYFAIVFRVLWPLAQSLPWRQLEAAVTLGASPFRAFWVADGPRWWGALTGAFAMVAAASLGEVAAVSLFYSERLVPLPLLISRWMAQYRFEDAQVLAGLLLLLSAGAVIFIARSLSGVQSRPI